MTSQPILSLSVSSSFLFSSYCIPVPVLLFLLLPLRTVLTVLHLLYGILPVLLSFLLPSSSTHSLTNTVQSPLCKQNSLNDPIIQ